MSPVTSHCEDGICTLTLNRPDKLNAIDHALILALRDAMASAQQQSDVRIIILTGAGRAFCAGNDLEATAGAMADGVSREQAQAHARDLQEVTRQICFGSKVVVAAVHGWAVGAGFEWVLNCDFSVWERSARAFFPEVRLGVFPTGGVLTLLPRIAGLHKAREMLLLGEQCSAEQLADMGLVTRIADDGAALDGAVALARQLLELPQDTVSRLKAALATTPFLDLEQTLRLEEQGLVESVMSLAQAGPDQP
jgi:enoyl-CoA hydratase/carnithine racemase